MSLAHLPTELDTKLVEFCDHKSQHALCSTSKYWNAVAEPFLYQHIKFLTDDKVKAKTLLMTLMKRPSLALHVKHIVTEPSPALDEEVISPFPDDFRYYDTGIARLGAKNEESKDALSGEVGKDTEKKKALQRQQLHDECLALLPEFARIINSTWPQLSAIAKNHWTQYLKMDDVDMDIHLAMILTIATNLEVLKLQCPKRGDVTMTCLILHYHRTLQEVASTNPYPFQELIEIELLGIVWPKDPACWMTYYVPLPIFGRSLVIRDWDIDHFEYPATRETHDFSLLIRRYGEGTTPVINQMHHGFMPMLRILDISKSRIHPVDLAKIITSGYLLNVLMLRLHKIGEFSHWQKGIKWAAIGHAFRDFIPTLQVLELSTWWDEPEESFYRTEPGEFKEAIGGLHTIATLRVASMEMGALVPASSENKVEELLALPGTILPVNLESLTLTSVKPEFLNEIAREGPSTAGQGILQRFVAALPDCAELMIETYKKPSKDTLEVLEMIADSLHEMDVAFGVWWCAPYSDDHEQLS